MGARAIGDFILLYRHLERRQLPDAVRAERRARGQGASPVPLELLLLVLQVARDDRALRAFLDQWPR